MTDQSASVITRIEELSYELKIAAVMKRDVKVVPPEMKMSAVLDLLREARISGAPVVRGQVLVGIISLEDLVRALRSDDLAAPVEHYMSTQIVSVRDTDPVVEALKIFAARNVGRLPVIDTAGQLAGIITKGNITDGLLRTLQADYQTEEIRRYRASHLFDDLISDRTSATLRYRIRARDFTNGGTASSHIKRALLRLGADTQTARRCGIAVYEAEMNLIIHTLTGGRIMVEVDPQQIYILVEDDGPGIPDIAQARRPGYTTASAEIREMGFGAGMGLVNIERCVDDMLLDSTVGEGTRLQMTIDLAPPPSPPTGETV